MNEHINLVIKYTDDNSSVTIAELQHNVDDAVRAYNKHSKIGVQTIKLARLALMQAEAAKEVARCSASIDKELRHL